MLDYFKERLKSKFFKNAKDTFLAHVWPILPIFGQSTIFIKILLSSFLVLIKKLSTTVLM